MMVPRAKGSSSSFEFVWREFPVSVLASTAAALCNNKSRKSVREAVLHDGCCMTEGFALTVRKSLMTRIRPLSLNRHSVTTKNMLIFTLQEAFFLYFLSFSYFFGEPTSAWPNCSLQAATIGRYRYPSLKLTAALSNRGTQRLAVAISGLMLESSAERCVFVSARCACRKSAPQLLRLSGQCCLWLKMMSPSSCTWRAFFFFFARVGNFWLKGGFFFRCFFYLENPECVISSLSN